MAFLTSLAEQGGEVPAALQNRPQIQGFDLEIWNAFARLSARRPVSGFGAVGAIPYAEMVHYLDHVARIQDEDDRAVFFEVLDHLDTQFLSDHAERVKKESAKNAPRKGAATRPKL